MQNNNPTVRDAIKNLKKTCLSYLPNKDSDIIRILEYVLRVNETGVFSRLDDALTKKELTKINSIIKRLSSDEPLEYITNTGYFYGRRFRVTKDTLIPRPETEVLIDIVISEVSKRVYDPSYGGKQIQIIDVGTGTGCIPISISLAYPDNVEILSVDISEKALLVAQNNIKTSKQTKNIKTIKSDLLQNISKDKKFDIIAANLPYISSNKISTLPSSVKNFEPHISLDGGKNGEDLIKRLLSQSKNHLKRGGIIALEADPDNIRSIQTYSRGIYPNATTEIIKDYSDNERFLIIKV